MKKTTQRVLALLLAILMLTGTATVGFAAAVGQVTNLALASRTNNQIKIKWKSVSKASGYLVESYDADERVWNIEDYTSNTYFVDKSLTPGTKYTYRVKAYVKNGSERVFGSASEKLSVLTNPDRVMKITASSATPTSVKLSWAAAAGATSYMLYQGTAENGKFKQIVETSKTSYKLSFDSAPGTLYFKVKASAKSGSLLRNADASPAFKVSLLPTTVATVTVSDYSATSVNLKWDASKGATGYYVLQKDATTGGEYVQIAKTANTSYQVNFPAAPGTVYFKVTAFSKLNGVITKGKNSAAVKLSLKPEKVVGLTYMNATSSTLTLVWSSSDGATAYEVAKRNEATLEYEPIATVTETTYTVTGLQKNTAYNFCVTALAEYKGVTLRAPKSDYLTNVSTEFNNVTNFQINMENDGKTFASWGEVKGADGYLVEKSTDGGTTWTQIADTKDCFFEVTGVEPNGVFAQGVNYSYRVCAYTNENGERITTDYAGPINARGKAGVPEITRIGSASQHSICVEWASVDGADGYQLQVYFDGKWDTPVDDLTKANTFKTYTNEKGVKTAYYCYPAPKTADYKFRVCSFVDNGGHVYSEYSEEKSHHYDYPVKPQEKNDYSEELQKTGIVGYLYDQKNGVFYTADEPWQHVFGFNKVYDIASPFIMLPYDTDRIKFTCHGGEKWMIQPWKGQYGMVLYGSEVGVYKQKNDRNIEHYDCVDNDDCLMMSMEFYRRPEGSTTFPSEPEFVRPYDQYWWVTGFKFGFIRMVNPFQAWNNMNFPDVRITFRITMLDYDMAEAFNKALREEIEAGKTKYPYVNEKGEKIGRFEILNPPEDLKQYDFRNGGLDFWIAYV
ncbi:MAG: DUF4474 domain-containing protein [Clostridia bacterium]|nr:DUF4474 domain-containing protein [Clostridia bacterium]